MKMIGKLTLFQYSNRNAVITLYENPFYYKFCHLHFSFNRDLKCINLDDISGIVGIANSDAGLSPAIYNNYLNYYQKLSRTLQLSPVLLSRRVPVRFCLRPVERAILYSTPVIIVIFQCSNKNIESMFTSKIIAITNLYRVR